VGHTEAIAASAGLEKGDTLLAIDGTPTPTWSEAGMALVGAAMDRRDVDVAVRTPAGSEAHRPPRLSNLPADLPQQRVFAEIGLRPRHQLLPAVVGRVSPGSAAWGVLAEGDRLTAIDGQPITSFDEISPRLQEVGHRPAMIEVERDGDRLALEVTPTRGEDASGAPYWMLGIAPAPAPMPDYDATLQHGPVAAVPAALRETWKLARDSVAMIGRLLSGRASVENVSGPITIARYANASAQLGAAWFLNFLALLSLSLAIINL